MTTIGMVALVVGILMASGVTGSAQENSPTPTPAETDIADATGSAQEDTDAGDTDDVRPHHGRGHFFAKGNAAEILGLTEDELRAAFEEGQTLAEVAVAQGMTVEDFTAQLKASIVADLDEKLAAGDIDQERYDEITAGLDERVDIIVTGTFPGPGDHGGGHFFVKGNAAEILGLTEDELRAAFEEGQTLAEVAVAQGMTVEDFTVQLKASIIADLDEKLAAGDIDQQRYDEITADLDTRLDDIVNSTPGERGSGGFGHGGPFRGGPPADDSTDGASFSPSFQGGGA